MKDQKQKPMKYAILSLGVYKRYVAICSVTDVQEFIEEFELVDIDKQYLFIEAMDEAKAFMFASYIKGVSLVCPEEDYEQRCYFIIHNNRDVTTQKITHGILSHEIAHIVQALRKDYDGTEGFGHEAESYLDEVITDFVYEFFQENKIPIYCAKDIEFQIDEKYKKKVKQPRIF